MNSRLILLDRITDTLGEAPTEEQVDAVDRFRQACDEVADILPPHVLVDAMLVAEREEALRRAEDAESTLAAIRAMLSVSAPERLEGVSA